MPAYSAPIEVVQAALHRVGEEEITSLDDDSSGARVAASNYEGIVRSFFARHAWTFAKQTLALTYQGAVELGPYLHAFVWPSTVMNVRYIMQDGVRLRSGEYTIESGRVLTRSNRPLQVVATVRADEAGKSCPYSMEPFALGDAVAECPKCGQVLSRESWRENRGCTTYGCEGAPDFRKDAPRIPPPIL